MKIELKNIGTVKHAEIDLDKNLLIFCGPNNSGKTYVANTLYGLYNNPIEIDKKYEPVENIIRSNFQEGEMVFTIDPNIAQAILKEKELESKLDLGNLFSSGENSFSSSLITIEVSNEEITKKIEDLTFKSTFSTSSYNCTITKIPGSNTALIKTVKKTWETNNQLHDELHYSYIASIIKGTILRAFLKYAFIAPVERIAINIFSKELLLKRSGLLEASFNDDLKIKDRYSIPIMVSLRISQDLANLEKNRSDYYLLANQIEENILKGKISISKNGDMLFNPLDSKTTGLDMRLSGSMVNALASLVFYFRRLANKGDFIVIDEPELNLHPDNQIIMARILARIVNAGFKVLISTHSDYIIKELNNLVRLNSKKEHAQEIMQRYGYSYDELLEKDSLGVYLFKNNTAKSLEVDELGFDVSTIEKVNSELAQISESIYFDLLDKDDE